MKFFSISLETPQLGGRRSAGGLQFTSSALEANLKLADSAVQNAILTAIREASEETRELAVRELSAKVACERGLVEERVKSEKVTLSRPRGTITILRKPIDLRHFRAVQVAEGVSVNTGFGRDRFYPSAFGPNIKRLGGNVFRRTSRERLPIRKMRGVSLVSVARKSGVDEMLRIQFQYRARVKIKANLVRAAFGIFRN